MSEPEWYTNSLFSLQFVWDCFARAFCCVTSHQEWARAVALPHVVLDVELCLDRLRIKLRVQENIQVGLATSSLLLGRVRRVFVRSILFLERTRGITANLNDQRKLINFYIITKSMWALSLVNQLWFTVPVYSWKNRTSSELLYKSNRPQVSMVQRHDRPLECS